MIITYSLVGSIFLLTGFGNLTLWLGVFVILVFLSCLNRISRLYILGYFIGACSVFFFESTHNNHFFVGESIKGEISALRTSNSYELNTSDGMFLVQTWNKNKLSEGSIIYVSFDSKKLIHATGVFYTWFDFDIHGLFTQNFSYEKRLYMKGYRGSINAQSIALIDSGKTLVRGLIRESINKVYGNTKEGALLYGMLFGGRVGMNQDDYDGFINSGLVHIIAVSGSNIMMVVITLHYMLFFVPLLLRRIIIGGGIICYLYICGFDSSLVRAVIMALINILVLFGGIKISFKRVISYTILLMLLYNPYYLLYDIGFLLSIAALFGLRLVTIFFQSYNKFIKEFVLPPIFSFLSVVPVILLFVGKINIISFVTTLIIGPFLSAIMILGLVSLFINFDAFSTSGHYVLSSIYKLSEYGQSFGVYMMVSGAYESILVVFCTCFVYYCLIKYVLGKRSVNYKDVV